MALRDSLIFPDAGSRPKYFTEISCPMENPSALAWPTWTQTMKNGWTEINTHTHTHPFNVPLSRTTRVSQYQKGKTNVDFTEARDSEWQWHQLGHMQVCTSLQTTMPALHHSVFYRPDALPAVQPTASKHWRQLNWNKQNRKKLQNTLTSAKYRIYATKL